MFAQFMLFVLALDVSDLILYWYSFDVSVRVKLDNIITGELKEDFLFVDL